MWRLVLILAFISCCRTAPQSGSLEDLINGVFSQPPSPTSLVQPVTRAPERSTQVKPVDDLDDLIADVFRTNKSTQVPDLTLNPLPTTVNPASLGSKNTEPNSENCECVPYYQCHQGSILDNGVGLIDIRSNFDDNNEQYPRVQGPCDNYLDVCCDPPNVRKPEDKVTPPPRIRTGCGKRNPEGVGFRITGQTDNEAQFGEFPWMVAILKEEIIGSDGQTSKLNVYQCGGALIHTRVVLTAAHCVNGKKPSELRIRAGEWDTQTKSEIFPHQDRFVENIIVHEKFHSGALRNDIALLILSQPVELAENVDIVCLPEAGMNFDGTRCVASGWGKDVFGKQGHYQVILKRVELPMVPHQVCENSLRQTRLGKYFALDRSFVCAGGEPGKDTCKGDGGSPLVCPLPNDRNRYVQTGIVAWGIGCGDQTPGVYANVAYARRWIDEQMAFNNLDTTVYQYHP